jgi:hypothetical protein
MLIKERQFKITGFRLQIYDLFAEYFVLVPGMPPNATIVQVSDTTGDAIKNVSWKYK